jgi:transposase
MYNIGNPHSIKVWQQQHERGELRSLQRTPSLDNSVPTRKKTFPQLPEREQSE